MSDRRKVLGDIAAPSAEDLRESREENFEEQIVLRLCSHYRVPTKERYRMQDAVSGATGKSWLSLDAWYNRFPDFPIFLGVKLITHVSKEATVSKMFLNFRDRRFVKEFDLLQEKRPELMSGAPSGLVFKWPHFPSRGAPPSGLVLTDRPPTWAVPGTRICWVPSGGDERESPLYIEPLSQLLNSIDYLSDGKKWQPATE